MNSTKDIKAPHCEDIRSEGAEAKLRCPKSSTINPMRVLANVGRDELALVII